MNKIILISLSILFLAACSGNKNENENSGEQSDTTNSQNQSKEVLKDTSFTDIQGNKITGFESPEALADALVEILKEKDFDKYYKHVMTPAMEKDLSEKIENDSARVEFLKEFGFSLTEEESYFKNLVKYLDEQKIDLNKYKPSELEYIEYKKGRYAPLRIIELFIPIAANGFEQDIVCTAVEINGRYYFTSELEL